MKQERLDGLYLLIPGTIWGASFLFMAEGLRATGPGGVTLVRLLIGFLTLSLFPAVRRPIARRDWIGVAGVGVLWMALPLTLLPLAEQRVSSALTGMLNGAVPVCTAVVAALLARRLPSGRITAGLAVGLGGAVLMALPGINAGHSSAVGIVLITAAVVSYGFALNLARPLQVKYGALPVIWRAQIVALCLTTPLGLRDVLAAHWSPGPVLSLLALGALGTGAAFIFATTLAGRVGATRASAMAFLIPPVALALGVLVRGERVAPLAILGAAICVAGAELLRRAQSTGPAQRSAPAPVAAEAR